MEKNDDRYKRYREKNIESIREKDRARKAVARESLTNEQKAKNNEGSKQRMRKYRQRMKQRAAQKTRDSSEASRSKPATSASKAIKAEKDKRRQQRYRDSLSYQKKVSIATKRRKQYREKKAEKKEKMATRSDAIRRLVRISKSKITIPAHGENFAECLDQVINNVTPRRQKLIEERGIYSSDERFHQRELAQTAFRQKQARRRLYANLRVRRGVSKAKLAA